MHSFLEIDNRDLIPVIHLTPNLPTLLPEIVSWSKECKPGDAFAYAEGRVIIICLQTTWAQTA
jgi:hypothetical protein